MGLHCSSGLSSFDSGGGTSAGELHGLQDLAGDGNAVVIQGIASIDLSSEPPRDTSIGESDINVGFDIIR